MAITKKVVGKGRKTIKTTPKSTNVLSTEINEPPENLWEYTVCFYGKKGIGKTSLAAQFPNAFVFMWEPGRRNLRIRQQNMYEIPESERWAVYKELQQQALDDDSIGVIVNDTVDRLYEACLAGNLYDRGIKAPPSDDYGQTWREVKSDLEDTLDLIRIGEKGHVMLSHETERDMTTIDGANISVVQPSCMPAAFKYIQAAADFAFYYGISEGHHAMFLRGIDNFIWAGCGSDEHFMEPKGEPVSILDMGTNPSIAYSRLVDSFNNKLYDISYVEEKTNKPVVRKLKK